MRLEKGIEFPSTQENARTQAEIAEMQVQLKRAGEDRGPWLFRV